MTVIRARLSAELARALEHYRKSLPTDTSEELIVQEALKRLLLEEGILVEEELLSETEQEALERQQQGRTEYLAWDSIRDDL
ncbi:MAG: hypothetical protein JSV66_04555 [Trueperaceae bacterium]|nr:MAG: hypothetical protein JSV66_04555 [Trueperaceae bacterium]